MLASALKSRVLLKLRERARPGQKLFLSEADEAILEVVAAELQAIKKQQSEQRHAGQDE